MCVFLIFFFSIFDDDDGFGFVHFFSFLFRIMLLHRVSINRNTFLLVFVYICVAILCILTPSAYSSAEYTLGTLGGLEDRPYAVHSIQHTLNSAASA